jgi:hypothetical protein
MVLTAWFQKWSGIDYLDRSEQATKVELCYRVYFGNVYVITPINIPVKIKSHEGGVAVTVVTSVIPRPQLQCNKALLHLCYSKNPLPPDSNEGPLASGSTPKPNCNLTGTGMLCKAVPQRQARASPAREETRGQYRMCPKSPLRLITPSATYITNYVQKKIERNGRAARINIYAA